MSKIPLIIDCDPGIDDAVSILLALASPEIDLLGITTLAGNAPLEITTRNALNICKLAGREDIPVYAGCSRPLLRAPIYGEFHGREGLGGVVLAASGRDAEAVHAVTFLVESCRAAARVGRKITLCTQGPLTNIALALRQAPDIVNDIERVITMGGSFRAGGNRTMCAEFNMLCDPHAARIVFEAALPLIMMPLDVTHQAMATPERVERLRAAGGRIATTVADFLTFWDRKDLKRYGMPGGPLHDPLVVARVLWPELFLSERTYITIECDSPLCLAQTLADWWGKSGCEANADITTSLNADVFFVRLTERLGSFPLFPQEST